MTIILPRQESPPKVREVSAENCTRELHTQLLRYLTVTNTKLVTLLFSLRKTGLFFHCLASLFSHLLTDHLNTLGETRSVPALLNTRECAHVISFQSCSVRYSIYNWDNLCENIPPSPPPLSLCEACTLFCGLPSLWTGQHVSSPAH